MTRQRHDRITHLEADRQELEERLASLESAYEVLTDFNDDIEQECADFMVENRKLRELCKDMYENPYALSECWECPHCVNGCISNCYYRDRMRELGIEVDEC